MQVTSLSLPKVESAYTGSCTLRHPNRVSFQRGAGFRYLMLPESDLGSSSVMMPISRISPLKWRSKERTSYSFRMLLHEGNHQKNWIHGCDISLPGPMITASMLWHAIRLVKMEKGSLFPALRWH